MVGEFDFQPAVPRDDMAEVQLLIEDIYMHVQVAVLEDRPAAFGDDEDLAFFEIPQSSHQGPDVLRFLAVAGEIDVGVGASHLLLQVAVFRAVGLEGQRPQQAQVDAGSAAGVHDTFDLVLEPFALGAVLRAHPNRSV